MRTPLLVKYLLHPLIWRIPVKEKKIFLTFDDGPIPVVTPWVLETLKQYNAKATFFCVGDNVRKNPEIYSEILKQGHRTGNHTMNHLNGWFIFNKEYIHNIQQAEKYIHSNLFRPPYGKIRPTQAYKLKSDYKIIMWDILTHDYDLNETGEACFQRVKKNARPGSIVVFHDSLKAEKNLRHALPASLDYLSQLGYAFESIA